MQYMSSHYSFKKTVDDGEYEKKKSEEERE
jgi:hypothetical protein